MIGKCALRRCTKLTRVHATCIALDGHGILIRGASGSGKSDLALRMIVGGGELVADDQVDLTLCNGVVIVRAPETIVGLLEVRGIGVVAIGSASEAPLALVVDLVSPEDVERMPKITMCDILGVPVRCVALTPFESSAPAKVILALRVAVGIVAHVG